MKNSKVITVFLILASIIGFYVGGGLAFFPAELQAQSGIIISSPSHYSETRAPGTAILAGSVIILIGAFRLSWRNIALLLTSMFFLSYGFGRLLSLILDGMPAPGLFYAMIVELAVGAIAFFLLLKSKTTFNQP